MSNIAGTLFHGGCGRKDLSEFHSDVTSTSKYSVKKYVGNSTSHQPLNCRRRTSDDGQDCVDAVASFSSVISESGSALHDCKKKYNQPTYVRKITREVSTEQISVEASEPTATRLQSYSSCVHSPPGKCALNAREVSDPSRLQTLSSLQVITATGANENDSARNNIQEWSNQTKSQKGPKKVRWSDKNSVKTYVSPAEFEHYKKVLSTITFQPGCFTSPRIQAVIFMHSDSESEDFQHHLVLVAMILKLKLGRDPQSQELLEAVMTFDEKEVVTSFIEICQTEKGSAAVKALIPDIADEQQLLNNTTQSKLAKQSESEHNVSKKTGTKFQEEERKPTFSEKEYTFHELEDYDSSEGFDEWW